MFGSNGTSIFSFSKIMGGISKTLGVVNQIIPIYKEAKPMIGNIKNAASVLKEFGTTSTQRIIANTEKNTAKIKENINNYPTFFK